MRIRTTLTVAVALGFGATPIAAGQTASDVAGSAEVDPAAAANIATNEARLAHQQGELSLTIAHSTFAQARAVTEGEPPSAAQEASASPQIREWWRSPSYMVVMQAPHGGVFTPIVPVPRGHQGPSGSVMTVIIEARSGVVDGRSLSTAPPPVALLGPVLSQTVAAASAGSVTVASIRSPRANPYGIVLGQVRNRHRAVRRWHVVLGRSLRHPAQTLTTTQEGTFGFKLRSGGRFVVAARKPHGGFCGEQHIVASKEKTFSLVLEC